ncbi:MAG: heme ABC exporter ATP-binding protein CcmA [Oceanococcaceae bacterium]
MTPLLSVRQLHHERGDRELFGGLDVDIHGGEILQVVGPNGHGKSTLLRILAGLIRPDVGTLAWRGRAFTSWEDEPVAPLMWLGERPGWAAAHSVEHNWRYLRSLRGLTPDREACWIDPAWWPRRFGDLSTGQRKRASLAFIEISGAAVWFLDEPLSGLDVAMSAQWQSRMQQAASRGTAIVLVSHDALTFSPDRVLTWTGEY